MLHRDQTVLAVIDVQEKMMPVIQRHNEVIDNIVRLVRASRELDLPMVVSEQYTRGLGYTVPRVREALFDAYQPIEKITFSSAGEPAFMERLEATGRKQVLLCGVETHVCVYQTARDLVAKGYHVEVAVDAVGSRAESNHRMALDRMARLGAELTSVEMALFEVMVRADIPAFRAISKIVR